MEKDQGAQAPCPAAAVGVAPRVTGPEQEPAAEVAAWAAEVAAWAAVAVAWAAVAVAWARARSPQLQERAKAMHQHQEWT
ncbi:MAG: hypothetical protein CVU73_07470 [Deltaproteobacteria bacterium HGW-Deltaproteobacteria-8]|nr:MAG: hypothetical protein CVU73_07470 [Deltaproteobacteria bacterium HGW-Deltaproteobacteria-8]